MALKEFLQDSAAISAGMWGGRTFSLPTLRKLAGFGGKVLASRQKSNQIKNIKANQWVVTGESLNQEQLQEQTLKVTTSMVTSLFEYFYYYQHPEEGKRSIHLTPEAQNAVRDMRDRKVPTFVLGPHIGNFDLFGMTLCWLNVPIYVLAYPNPNNAYKAQNKLRAAVGMDIHPLSFSAFRGAKQALKEGKTLVTGMDRPLENQEDAKYKHEFFGRPAALPSFYARLCLETGAVARVACGVRQENGDFLIDSSKPIEMEARPDLVEENLINVGKVLREAEVMIREHAQNWAMFYPVWPEVKPIIEHLL